MQAHFVGFAVEQLSVTRMVKKKNLFPVQTVETVVGLLLNAGITINCKFIRPVSLA